MADTPGRNGRRDEGEMEALIRAAREGYNPPPDTPREAIWAAIQDQIQAASAEADPQAGVKGTGTPGAEPAGAVADLASARRRRAFRFEGHWAWAAAAGIVLLMGIGIGRFTATGSAPGGSQVAPRSASSDPAGAAGSGPEASGQEPGDAPAGAPDAGIAGYAGSRVADATAPRSGREGGQAGGQALHVAALRHLGQTESLLTMVRTEGRSGSLDPQVGTWARTLLVQTRFLLDAQTADTDPAVRKLMEDLELVLAQIVGVTESETTNDSRAKAELDLALKGLDEKEVLTRIQAVS